MDGNPFDRYEEEKKKLVGLTPEEYEKAVQALAEKLEL